MSDLTYLQSVVIGALQGVTELFPVSSLGHSVLVPAWLGGDWKHLVTESSTATSEQSPYLAFIVALHVATAIALLGFYWRNWVAIIKALWQVARTRTVQTSTERLGVLLVVATIPVGITGLALEHPLRTLFAKPLAAAIFLTVNGVILGGGELLRRRAAISKTQSTDPAPGTHRRPAAQTGRSLDTLRPAEAGLIGLFQTLALLAGISRSGITMVGGLLRGLDHEDAAKFSFLLATPIIFAAGVLKLPSLAGSAGAHIHGQVLVGFLTAGICAYLTVRFLTRYFTTRTLTPFAVYCLAAGGLSIAHFA
ncbi:MAG: undecaprenyl-diphosphate phosphatase [Catenulispora sp.]|nr:undecaprenyl-diphosphate phosphatase [Catenulispora sp.]NUR61030.1 undecaprenyl-diphosphate phosphatase [Catenulispora sp.]